MTPSTRARFIALVGALAGERRAAHTAGYPLDPSKMLPLADVLLLVESGDAGAMLFRYTAYGEFGGDTLHGSTAEARYLADEEYGDALGPWVEVPADVADAHAWAVQYAAERLDRRGDW